MTASGILRRLAVIVFAYLAAAIFAGVVVGSYYYFWDAPADAGAGSRGLLRYIFFAAYFAAIISAIPALVVVAIAEFAALRNWPAFAIGGAATGFILPLILFGTSLSGIDAPTIFLGIATGACSGLIYWLIAGRSAGAFRRRRI